jgi:hypothetical protein
MLIVAHALGHPAYIDQSELEKLDSRFEGYISSNKEWHSPPVVARYTQTFLLEIFDQAVEEVPAKLRAILCTTTECSPVFAFHCIICMAMICEEIQATIETVDADSDPKKVEQAVGDIGEYFRAMFQLFLNKFTDKEINRLKSADGEELQPLRALIQENYKFLRMRGYIPDSKENTGKYYGRLITQVLLTLWGLHDPSEGPENVKL